MTRRVWLWGPVVLQMAALFYASSQPDLPTPPGLPDKPTHSAAYFLLSVLISRALAGGFGLPLTPARALAAVTLSTAYGVTDEIHQMFVPGRSAELNDLVADAIGAGAGAFACWLWGIIRRQASRHGL